MPILDMLPLAKDAFVGVVLITNLACIYARTGEKISPWKS
jgi:hypothetical protein